MIGGDDLKYRIVENSLKPRLVRRDGLCIYVGLGRNLAVAFAKEAGAEVKYGRCTLYDLNKIDKAIDRLVDN